MPDGPGTGGEQGDLVARLRAVIGAKDEQITALTASLEAALAALAAEDVLAADETPVNVLDQTAPRHAPGETEMATRGRRTARMLPARRTC